MSTYNGRNEDSSGNILLSIGNGMTATLETGTTASQAYTKGAYVFFNNRLCKVSTAIASGATLAIGTNLTQTSIGVELTSHLRSSDGKEFYFDYQNDKYGYNTSASREAATFVPFGGTAHTIKAQATWATKGADGTLYVRLYIDDVLVAVKSEWCSQGWNKTLEVSDTTE